MSGPRANKGRDVCPRRRCPYSLQQMRMLTGWLMPVVLASSGQVELRGEELQGPLGLYSRILSLGAKIKQMKAQNKCTNFHVGKRGQVILDPEILAKDSFFQRPGRKWSHSIKGWAWAHRRVLRLQRPEHKEYGECYNRRQNDSDRASSLWLSNFIFLKKSFAVSTKTGCFQQPKELLLVIMNTVNQAPGNHEIYFVYNISCIQNGTRK